MSLWAHLATALRRDGRASLITLVAVEGSSPREAGTRMLVLADGRYSGTIGGGALEWQAMAEAQRLMQSRPDGAGEVRSFSLGPDLGQCCGGRVRLLIEAFAAVDLGWIEKLAAASSAQPATESLRDARGIYPRYLVGISNGFFWKETGFLHEAHGENRTPLLLFGAGHVGRALILALAPLPFAVRWIDMRPEAFPAATPANVTCIHAADPVGEITAATAGTLVLAMTHSHALDLDIAAAALANPSVSFTGVIGSATKRARFASRLKAMGIAPASIARMACPVGLRSLKDKSPAVIAAGIAVELLTAREAQAERIRNTEEAVRATLA